MAGQTPLAYSRRAGSRLDQFPADGRTHFAIAKTTASVHSTGWTKSFGYTIGANAARALLLRLMEIAYQQTAPDGARAKLPPAPGKASGL
jgi:hypothetical protein